MLNTYNSRRNIYYFITCFFKSLIQSVYHTLILQSIPEAASSFPLLLYPKEHNIKASERREQLKVRENLQMLEGQDLCFIKDIMTIHDTAVITGVIHFRTACAKEKKKSVQALVSTGRLSGTALQIKCTDVQ